MTEPDPAPIPELPRDAGVAETEPDELGALEGARVLENDAREQLSARVHERQPLHCSRRGRNI